MPLTVTLTPGALPADGDVITNATLRAIAAPTVDLEGSIGSSSIADGSVTTAKLAAAVLSADATGRAKMEDAFVNAAKLGTDAVTTAKILANNVTLAKLAEDVTNGAYLYAADTTNTNSYAITLSPAPTAYAAGMEVRFKVTNANTSTVTLNVNALGAKNVYSRDGKALIAGQIAAGAMVTAVYDGTQFITALPSRTASALTVAPGTSAKVDIAHGFSVVPTRWRVVLVQTDATARNGYAQNDECGLEYVNSASSGPAFNACADATNVTVSRQNNSPIYQVPKAGGGVVDINSLVTTNNYFKLRVYAEL